MDPGCMDVRDKRMAWILVELQYSSGLPGNIYLEWGLIHLRQRLDYWGIPFLCLHYHHNKHLLDRFPYIKVNFNVVSRDWYGCGWKVWQTFQHHFQPSHKGTTTIPIKPSLHYLYSSSLKHTSPFAFSLLYSKNIVGDEPSPIPMMSCMSPCP